MIVYCRGLNPPSFLLTIVIHCRRKILDHIYVIKYQFLLVIFLLLLVNSIFVREPCRFNSNKRWLHTKSCFISLFSSLLVIIRTLRPGSLLAEVASGQVMAAAVAGDPGKGGFFGENFHRNHQFLCTWDWIGLPELMMSWKSDLDPSDTAVPVLLLSFFACWVMVPFFLRRRWRNSHS